MQLLSIGDAKGVVCNYNYEESQCLLSQIPAHHCAAQLTKRYWNRSLPGEMIFLRFFISPRAKPKMTKMGPDRVGLGRERHRCASSRNLLEPRAARFSPTKVVVRDLRSSPQQYFFSRQGEHRNVVFMGRRIERFLNPVLNSTRGRPIRERIGSGPPHFLDGCIYFVHGVAECRERILQAIWGASVHMNMIWRRRSSIVRWTPKHPNCHRSRARAHGEDCCI
jgi:hypothetical protein